MVRVTMREDDHVNVLRSNPLGLQVLKEFSRVWAKTICTSIYQHQMLTRIDQQTYVWTCPLCPVLWLYVILTKGLNKGWSWRIGKKQGGGWWEGRRCIGESAVANSRPLEGPTLK